MDTKNYRDTLSRFATGITVVISRTSARVTHGMTVNSFTSVSLNPPLVLFCADNRSDTFHAVQESRRFTVSILREEQEALSQRFALTGPQEELFQALPCQPGIDGIPYLAEGLAYLDCSVHQILPAGDHHIVIGQVDDLGLLSPGRPLLYYHSHYERLNLTPARPPQD